MTLYYIKSLGTFRYSISFLMYIIKENGFTIEHNGDSTSLSKDDIKVEVSHNDIKEYLMNNRVYKSYNLHIRAYDQYKDIDTDFARTKATHSLSMIDRMIYIYSIKHLITQLQEKQLISLTVVDK